MLIYKTCTKCKKPLPATREFFCPHKQTKDGLTSQCKVCRKKYSCKYRKNNPDKVKKLKQQQHKWRKNNPDKVCEYNARHRARIKNQTPELTEIENRQILDIYKKREELGSNWHVDHIIPLSKDGLHHPDNLQIVIKTYNLQKNNKLDFRPPNNNEIFSF